MKVLQLSLIFTLVVIAAALQCRTDGPSDEDLKRVTRSCMRKVGDPNSRYRQSQNKTFYSLYDDQDYDEYNRGDDRIRQGNRDRSQRRSGRMRRSSNDRRYDLSASSSRNQQQTHRGNNPNSGSGTGSSNSSGSDRQSRDMQQEHDGACVVHCFFEEMNMLNNDDYPDKYKVIHILTRDMRDRELRTFYTDTIQECFGYLEMQRRKGKCQFSKELINCMMQYARANCDDWDDRTLIFS